MLAALIVFVVLSFLVPGGAVTVGLAAIILAPEIILVWIVYLYIQHLRDM